METKLFLPGMVFAYLYFTMALINVTINQYGNDAEQTDLIIQKLDKMNEQVTQLKANLQESNAKADAILASQTAIRKDIETLNKKITDLSDGANREQIAELAALGASLKAKVDAGATTAAEIDALTAEETTPGGEPGTEVPPVVEPGTEVPPVVEPGTEVPPVNEQP